MNKIKALWNRERIARTENDKKCHRRDKIPQAVEKVFIHAFVCHSCESRNPDSLEFISSWIPAKNMRE